MPNRIGLFGATFDPPHLGHLTLASKAQSQLECNRLLWILTPEPPHKQDYSITPTEHRIAMVNLTISDSPNFEFSRVDIDRAGPHYTSDTIELIARQNPEAELVPIMGADSLRNLPTWHKPKEIVFTCHWLGVRKRPNEEPDLDMLERELPSISSKVHYVDAPRMEIKSRDLRSRIASGQSVKDYLPPGVYKYINQHQLYHQFPKEKMNM